MTDVDDHVVTVTMDRSGRLVLPQAIRDRAGLQPGVPLRVRVRGGRVEIEPEYAVVRTVLSHGLEVMERVKVGSSLRSHTVRRVVHTVRERRLG